MLTMFKCERCGYSSDHKHNLIRHLKGKKECKPLLSNKSIDDLIHQASLKEFNENTFDCEYCYKKFNSRSSMYRHVKMCKMKCDDNLIEKLSSKMEALEKELNEFKQCTKVQCTSHTSIQQNNINQMHIHINNYGHETTDHLPKDFITSCFMMKNIPSLIENLHFDNDCPQNKNIKLKSLKHKIINVYEDDKWIAKPADSILDELVNKGQTILKKHYRNNKEDVQEDMTEEEIDEVIEWLTQIWENNEKIRKPLKMELIALLENYR